MNEILIIYIKYLCHSRTKLYIYLLSPDNLSKYDAFLIILSIFIYICYLNFIVNNSIFILIRKIYKTTNYDNQCKSEASKI
jgi:hypothetical protein